MPKQQTKKSASSRTKKSVSAKAVPATASGTKKQPSVATTIVASAAEKIGRKLDAFPDRVDIRDWWYQPRLVALPDQLINCHHVPAILDQGAEGACTGFALAAVINFLLARRGVKRSASARMLYEMARRYDQWPGEDYEGSSARGAMKGWMRHGVCEAELWLNSQKGPHHLTPDVARAALYIPGGAFYRVMHRQVRDIHAALHEVGIVYCTLMVHEGWDTPSGKTVDIIHTDDMGNRRQLQLPVIKRQGRADSGHAIALVGYTIDGFIVQNSWSDSWGTGGFALLPYEDFLLHATDVWVAQLGVPVSINLWSEENMGDSTAGLGRVEKTVPLNEIRPYVIDAGNNGELSDSGEYWTTEKDVEHLFSTTIKEKASAWKKRRVLLYLHGGLNSEKAVAQRIVAFRDTLLANEIYPVHIMWETGFAETLHSIAADVFTDVDDRAGAIGEWWSKLRDGLVEAKDRSFELTTAVPGRALWNEMKENARLASTHLHGRGVIQLVAHCVQQALQAVSTAEQNKWELHIVAHSAGSIFIAHALQHLCSLGIPLKSIQFLAPAITLSDFEHLVVPVVKAKQCPVPTVYILSDEAERDDTVSVYGKSLLYLVSNAFERERETPLLGMQRFIQYGNWDSRLVNANVNALLSREKNGLPHLVIAKSSTPVPSASGSSSHGGFDNDVDTMNSVLWRILGREPSFPFEARDLNY